MLRNLKISAGGLVNCPVGLSICLAVRTGKVRRRLVVWKSKDRIFQGPGNALRLLRGCSFQRSFSAFPIHVVGAAYQDYDGNVRDAIGAPQIG